MEPDTIDISPARSIGGITFQATIREVHNDRLETTMHPVERGASITDHAFNLPAELVVEAAASNSSDDAGGDPDFVRILYQDLLALKQSAQVFEVITGKRAYDTMLMVGLALTTDERTEYALKVTMTLREIFLVDTQTTTIPPAEDQADQTKTAPVQPAGSVQTQPAPQANQSALSQLFGG